MNNFWKGFEKQANVASEAIRVGKGGVQLFGKREAIGAAHLKDMAASMPKARPLSRETASAATKSKWFDQKHTPRSAWNEALNS